MDDLIRFGRLKNFCVRGVVLVVGIITMLIFILLGINPSGRQIFQSADPVERNAEVKVQLLQEYGAIPMHFEKNMGQTDEGVKFISSGQGYTLFLTSTEAVLSLRKPGNIEWRPEAGDRRLEKDDYDQNMDIHSLARIPIPERRTPKSEVLRMQLVGANPDTRITGLDKKFGNSNYFIGKEPDKWVSNVPNYTRVKYEEIYPSIDLIFYGNPGLLEYDFIVKPGASPEEILLGFEGCRSCQIDEEGNLVLGTAGGEVFLRKPKIYQMTENEHVTINGVFQKRGENQIGFHIDEYDVSKDLVIDPELIYSTYLGGSGGSTAGRGIAVDAQGNAYVTGRTAARTFPTSEGAFQTEHKGDFYWADDYEVFVTKFNSEGSDIIYSTYIGGGDMDDEGLDIAIDADGNAYVTGITWAEDFPTTPGAFQKEHGDGSTNELWDDEGDAFVLKLNPTGSALVYSTFLGGQQEDYGTGIAVDESGHAYVSGRTHGYGGYEHLKFPVTDGAYQNGWGYLDDDGFATKLNPDGSDLVYSTLLDMESHRDFYTFATDIAIDQQGNAYISGQSQVLKLNASGTGILYNTPLHGSFYKKILTSRTVTDRAFGIAVDSENNCYIAGEASNLDFPTTENAYQSVHGNVGSSQVWGDAYVIKLNPSGGIVYSTFLGGSQRDGGGNIAVDRQGNMFVIGWTQSDDFPTKEALQPNLAGEYFDYFIAKIDPSRSGEESLIYSTYLGGTNSDYDSGPAPISDAPPEIDSRGGIAVDDDGNVYVTGFAVSFDFPTTPGAFDTIGVVDAFVAKIGSDRNRIIYDEVEVPPQAVPQHALLQFMMNAKGETQRFTFRGKPTDGMVGVRVINTRLRGVAENSPLQLEIKIFIDQDEIITSTLFNIGSGNDGVRFTVNQDNLYTIQVQALDGSPGPFPAPFQIHLASNVGQPKRVVNNRMEEDRATRLDILFNHVAPRPQTLDGQDHNLAKSGLFKFANPIFSSPYAVAVLTPPVSYPAGIPVGLAYQRAPDPAFPMSRTTPTARTPVCQDLLDPSGLVVDFTQVPDPAVVIDPPPVSGTMGAVIGMNGDGSMVTLPLKWGPVSLILDMGTGQEIVDGNGNDFRIYAQGGYTVAVSNSPYYAPGRETFTPIDGTVNGTQEFDLLGTGLKSVRYILVTASPSVDIDAIKALNMFYDRVVPDFGPVVDIESASITMRRIKGPETELDPFLELIAPDGDRFGENESGFGDDTSFDKSDAALLGIGLVQEGFYRYLGKGYHQAPDNQSFGTFFTRLESSGIYDPSEIQIVDTDEVSTNAQKTGQISYAHQRDSYLFKTQPGDALHIVVNALDGDVDPMVEVHDPEGFLLGSSDNVLGRGRNCLLSVVLPVTSFYGQLGFPTNCTYRIVVSSIDIPGQVTGHEDIQLHSRNVGTGRYELKVFRGALAEWAPPSPVISGVTPVRAVQGLTDLKVTLSGSHFSDNPSVQFSGTGILVKEVTVISSLQIEAMVDITQDASQSMRDVAVVNDDGKQALADAVFEVRENLGEVTMSWDAPTGEGVTAPSNLKAEYGGVPQTAKAGFSFAAASLQSYNIYRSIKPDAQESGSLVGNAPAGTTTFNDNVPHDGNYYYQATAVFNEGESDPSNEAVANVDPLEGTVPIVLDVEDQQLAGEEFWVDLMLGDEDNPAEDLFGLSLSMNYTQTEYIDVVTPHAANVIPGDFLGSDVVFFPVVDETTGKVSAGITRKAGQSGVNGSGTVLKVKFKIDPNTPDGTVVQLTMTEKTANDAAGASIGLYAIGKTVAITRSIGTPTFDPSPGTHNTKQYVTIRCATSEVTIRYTMDGSEPAESSSEYTAPILVSETKTLKARAYKVGWPPSDIATGTYTILRTGIDESETSIPTAFVLQQNYPNPFNPITTIAYSIPKSSHVKLEIYNLMGAKIKTLVDGHQQVGQYSVAWDTKDGNGSYVSGGMYLYRLQAGSYAEVRKMLLIR